MSTLLCVDKDVSGSSAMLKAVSVLELCPR